MVSQRKAIFMGSNQGEIPIMRSLLIVTFLALAGSANTCWAAECCQGATCPFCPITTCDSCKKTTCDSCPTPKCSDPCAHHCPALLGSPEKTQKLIEKLCSCDYCTRKMAVCKLSCPLHADVCKDPCALKGLTRALFSDSTWENRRRAAFGIYKQGARTEAGVLALYISSRLDPHVMVRAGADEALRLLFMPHPGCEKDFFAEGEKLVKELREQKILPGKPESAMELEGLIFRSSEGGCASEVGTPAPVYVPAPGVVVPAPVQIPAPGAVVPAPVPSPAAPAVLPAGPEAPPVKGK
jgi:hypothetical protein